MGRIGLRTGFERTVLKYKRWQGYFGVDAISGVYQYSNTSPYDTGVIRTRSGYTVSFGLSPLMGLNFQLNELVGFGIESSYDVLYETGITKIEYAYNGVTYQTINELYDGITTSYGSPLRLNLRICF